MIATYRLQLQPDFGFDAVRTLLPYFQRLGISHLYLSPITDARRGSTHGYDVVDHNRIRDELGGADAFWDLLKAARAAGLGLILDFVPNHAGVGSRNARWQDVLAYGPHSPFINHFDIDWDPLKPELRWKILLPFLDSPYGDALDRGDIILAYEQGRLTTAHGRNRFALAPRTYGDVLDAVLPAFEHPEERRAIVELRDAFRGLQPHERGKADALRRRLSGAHWRPKLQGALGQIRGEHLHAILESQFWRLSYWRTAASEINYRRFFDVNDLVGLQVEHPEVFADIHRLLATLVHAEGVEGIRVDHVDGLFDPHDYLARLKALGARSVWVEKILAHGETLPPDWPVEGTVGYEFLNDAMRALTWPGGELALDRVYRRFVRDALPYADEARRSRQLIMATALSGELFRLAHGLDRISEGDYHTRDFTLEALRDALAEVVAAFPRYRTYLPHDRQEAETVIRQAVYDARRRNPGTEPTVYAFIGRVLLGEVEQKLQPLIAPWVGLFQQYTAPVAAKAVEDTAFYRYLRLAALNEVGGEPDRFSVSAQAFHARARFRAIRYPRNLLATATHDHKRGEDTRMRMIVLAELPDAWRRTLGTLSRVARRHRRPEGPSRADEYLLYQTLVALWVGADRETLPERLVAYMRKAAREAKLQTSWINPVPEYEAALERFVREMLADPHTARAIEPLARAVAHYGFANSLSQLVLKLTSPGVPDFYQGCELLDLSLVDPDNRRPPDFDLRARLLNEIEPLAEQPALEWIRARLDAGDDRAKFYVIVRLLRFRRIHPALFSGDYRPLVPEGARADHLLAFSREGTGETMVVLVPRFAAALERLGGWEDTTLGLPEHLADRVWTEVLTGQAVTVGARLSPAALPLPWGVLLSPQPAARPPVEGEVHPEAVPGGFNQSSL